MHVVGFFDSRPTYTGSRVLKHIHTDIHTLEKGVMTIGKIFKAHLSNILGSKQILDKLIYGVARWQH